MPRLPFPCSNASCIELLQLWPDRWRVVTRRIPSAMCRLRLPGFRDRGNDPSGQPPVLDVVVPGSLVGDQPEEWSERRGFAACAGGEELQDGWTPLHKLRRAMVRPGRDRLQGRVKVDKALVGGEDEEVHGRPTKPKP